MVILCSKMQKYNILHQMHMIRKGQVEGVGKGEVVNQVKFIEDLFGVTV